MLSHGRRGLVRLPLPPLSSLYLLQQLVYYSTNVGALRELYPDRPRLRGVSDEARIIVSEPLGDLPGVWNAVPESSYGVVQDGEDELHPFRPVNPRSGG